MSILIEGLKCIFNMAKQDAVSIAETVEKAFEGKDEVSDEEISKEVRSLFYMLERERLLSVRREEYTIDGKTLRAFYWQYREINLNELKKDEREEKDIYKMLPDDVWKKMRH